MRVSAKHRIRVATTTAVAAGLWMAMGAALAQHETAYDVEEGNRAFQNSCANCHGPDGDLIAGIDLGRGVFRRPLTDQDIADIIMNGIPNTPMPPTPRMSEEQALRIVAYLRATAAGETGVVASGDPERGRALFEGKGGCMDCHRVHGRGSRQGPDLSRIGLLRRAVDLEESLLDPTAEVQADNRGYLVTLADGERIMGRLLNHDTYSVQMFDSEERLRSFAKADLRNFGFIESTMPSYRDTLSAQEIADIVSYMVSLQGLTTP